MAAIQKIRGIFNDPETADAADVIPAPVTKYSISPLTEKDLTGLMQLSVRCFRGSETYNRETFEYLLREPRVVAYQAVTASREIAAFLFIIDNQSLIAHITTIAVAPEHRQRGLGGILLAKAIKTLALKGFESVMLEVRASNLAAQNLYSSAGFVIIQRLSEYYNDGEDAYMMSRSLMK